MIKLIRQHKEGAREFRCDCGHNFVIPKFIKEIKCGYCGAKEVKAQELLPLA